MIDVLIVENEAGASAALRSLLENETQGVRVVGVCADVTSARQQILKTRPQIVFLDVELDGATGFDLLESFASPSFEIIFTTAHSTYALRAIKHACIDYLMKPVRLDELHLALSKFVQRENLGYKKQFEVLLENLKRPVQQAKLCIPVSGGYVFINMQDIIMCKADANYTFIFCQNGEKIVCSRNLGSVEDMIGDRSFFRSHKSYLINIQHIKKIWQRESPHVILQNDLEAEVSLRKKDELLDLLRSMNLAIHAGRTNQ